MNIIFFAFCEFFDIHFVLQGKAIMARSKSLVLNKDKEEEKKTKKVN